jgi:hypothetical protein
VRVLIRWCCCTTADQIPIAMSVNARRIRSAARRCFRVDNSSNWDGLLFSGGGGGDSPSARATAAATIGNAWSTCPAQVAFYPFLALKALETYMQQSDDRMEKYPYSRALPSSVLAGPILAQEQSSIAYLSPFSSLLGSCSAYSARFR